MRERDERWSLLGLGCATLLGAFLMAITGQGSVAPGPSPNGLVPTIYPVAAHLHSGDTIELRSSGGGALCLGFGADGPMRDASDNVRFVASPDTRTAERLLSTPISVNWRHPVWGLPAAGVVRIAERDTRGRRGPERISTLLFADHGKLPVLSMVVPSGALFDPDTGIMVVGNAIFDAPEKVLVAEYRDPRSWKYPGNFHMRGKKWERKGKVQLIAPDGRELLQTDAGIRINGQMTRSFPQHAFRLTFPSPVRFDFFGEPVRDGYASIVVRAAGNDQIRAMLRDVFQHRLCAGLPFEVSGHRTCVLYINGAYWGVHHLRPRMDEYEIARRYAVAPEEVTILEDEARLYRGDTMQVIAFEQLAKRTAAWDGKDDAWVDTLRSAIDVDGFFAYMASQMILANMDWPSQNAKYWRYTGVPRPERPLDGRWYFIMGDTDLGYGVQTAASVDLFVRANALDVPLTQLLRGMLRNSELRTAFIARARELATGPFSALRSVRELEAIAGSMGPEMARHTARWRRPGSGAAWRSEVDVVRRFAEQREAEVLEQLDAFERNGTGR